MEKVKFRLAGLDCANCALKLESKFAGIEGVRSANINFATNKGFVEVEADVEGIKEKMVKIASKFEDGVEIEFDHHHKHEEECSCGHNHHHHEHEEGCSCGHEHHQ